MILYNIKRGPHSFAIAKFDADLNLLAAYNTDGDYCSCPAGPRPTCRHRKMLPRMLGKVDTDEFYCYETQTWHQPLAVPGGQREIGGAITGRFESDGSHIEEVEAPTKRADPLDPEQPA